MKRELFANRFVENCSQVSIFYLWKSLEKYDKEQNMCAEIPVSCPIYNNKGAFLSKENNNIEDKNISAPS
jgi:hypothetical protein